MTRQSHSFVYALAIATVWVAMSVSVRGQDAFDFDVLDDEIAADGAAVDSSSLDSNAAPGDDALPGDAPSAPVVDSAVVDAIRATDPQSPGDLMRSVDQLIRLGYPEVAAEYLDRLINLSLDDAALSELYQQFGTAVMIRLARSSELAPAASEFATSVMQAGRRTLHDPKRLASWTQQLGSDDRTTRYRAAEQLLRGGSYSVGPLVGALADADASDATLRRWGFAVLQRLGADSLQPLYGILDSDDPARRATAVSALGVIGSTECLPHLVGPLFVPQDGEVESRAATRAWQQIVSRVPTRDEAVQLLSREADRTYQGRPSTAADPADQITRWVWDAPTKQPRPVRMRSRAAAALTAARLYKDLHRMRPDDRQAGERYLIGRLNVDKVTAGLDQPLPRGTTSAFEQLRQAGSSQVNQILRRALEGQQDAAAIGAAEVLGSFGDLSVLQRNGVDPFASASPLGLALTHPNRRVRFAAARAVAALKPSGSFDGAGRLADVLEYFISSRGHRAAVVAHPNQAMGQNLAGMLTARGFRVARVTTARELEAAASSSADVEFVLVSDALNHVSLWSAIESLRVHPKTARLPIGILARPTRRADAERMAEAHTRVTVFSETPDDQAMDLGLPQLLALADRDAISPDRRLEQARSALTMLTDLVDESDPAEIDLEVRAPELVSMLSGSQLIGGSTQLLGKIGTRSAQQALVDIASQHVRPLETRKAAAEAFGQSVDRFGMLIGHHQVAEQYERYNNSRSLDDDTQELLGAILDSIEGPEPTD